MLSKFVGGVNNTNDHRRIDEPCSLAYLRNCVHPSLSKNDENIVDNEDA